MHRAVPRATCHGENGIGLASANFVRLAGLNEDYLAKQLHDFKSGARENPIMKPIASALTDEEVNAVAGYFSQLPKPVAPAEKSAADASIGRGETLAREGSWKKEMPACFQCYGENGRGKDSFNWGAGMHRVNTAAGFIKRQHAAGKT